MYIKKETDYKNRAFNVRKMYGKKNKGADFTEKNMYDFYIKNLNNYKIINRNTAYYIFTDFTKMIVDEILLNGLEFNIPMGLGTISIRKIKRPKMWIDDDGFLHNRRFNYSIDYSATKKLWEMDKEAKEKKKVLFKRMDSDYIYKITHLKKKNYYSRIPLYQFVVTKAVKTRLAKYVRDGLIDDKKILNYV